MTNSCRRIGTAIVMSALMGALSSHPIAAFYLGSEPQRTSPLAVPPDEAPQRELQPTPAAHPNTPFVPWRQPFLVATGDYRNEASALEDPTLPLYSMQDQLPRLPLPALNDTIARFLPSALPLAETEAERQTLLEDCQNFAQQAQGLQERLERRRQDYSDSSWLQQLWQTQGYLQVRDPLAVKVSYYLFVPDDKTLGAVITGDAATSADDKLEKIRIARAAAMLVAMAESRQQICSGNMLFETAGAHQALCSTGFKYLFHATRIPTTNASTMTDGEITVPVQDVFHIHDPSRHSHCIVACMGQFYALDFCQTTGEPLPLSVLERRLQRCVQLAKSDKESSNSAAFSRPEMGWLTSCNRDVWAKARQELLDIGGRPMSKALAKLESGAFVLALDVDESETLTETAKVFWYGGDDTSGGNRWFDKSLQLVCTKNGRVGYVGEHSMLDAAPVLPLIRRIIKTTYKRLKQKEKKSSPSSSSSLDVDDSDGVTDIFAECWSSSPALTAAALKHTTVAKKHHKELTSSHELEVLLFDGYGKKFIKSAGFVCHDYAQMAMQLASYRLFARQVATYEAALTRGFLHGRTETVRPVSPESQAFIQCMGLTSNDTDCSSEEKFALLKQAAAKHDEIQRMASRGLGVDRHFFGLSSMLRKGETAPNLFSHPLYLRSKHWRLSTSAVIFTPGFGPVTDDGLGIGYRVDASSCMFTCSSRSENCYVQRFCNLLEEALVEMGNLVNANMTDGDIPTVAGAT